MHRIDTSTAQVDKFGSGKNGFTAGNIQTGTPATDLDNDYFDALQEELVGIVEAAGIVLDKTKHNQLYLALKKILLSRANPFADIKSDGQEAVDAALENLGLVNTGKLSGRLLAPPTLYSTSQSLTMPTTGNLFRLRMVGGGAGSGAVGATSASTLAASGGGGSGSYVELWLTRAQLQALFTASGGTIQLTIGAGGNGGVANSGGNGGVTSFGSFIICPGGIGSTFGTPVNSATNYLWGGGGPGNAPTISITGLPTAQIILSMPGTAAGYGITMNGPTLAGNGADSLLGHGGLGGGGSSPQSPGTGYGAGAGGVTNATSTAAKNGAAGSQGAFILEIYA